MSSDFDDVIFTGLMVILFVVFFPITVSAYVIGKVVHWIKYG